MSGDKPEQEELARLSPLAIVSAIITVAAVVVFFSSISIVFKLGVPLAAFFTAFFALSQIVREEGLYYGRRLARGSLVVSALLLLLYAVLKLRLML